MSGLRFSVRRRPAALALAALTLAGVPALTLGEASSVGASAEPAVFAGKPLESGSLLLGGGLDADWQFAALEGGLCVLEQPVTDFGTARFFAGGGTELVFELLGHRALAGTEAVAVEEVAPAWTPAYPASRALGRMTPVSGNGLSSTEPFASSLLLSLYQGYDLTLGPLGWSGAGAAGVFSVKLSGARIRVHYEAFLRCARNPNARRWTDVERTRINYPAAGWELSPDDRLQLEALAAFALTDPGVQTIYVDGHADATGVPGSNIALSRRRAETVSRALAAMGVPPDKLVTRYHGDRYPVADNGSESGRADNRRTTIRLERARTPPDTEVAHR